MKIAIIDTIGLTYDGNTLSKRGLGGSESAVILMSKELAELGLDVTVYNNCNDSDSTNGVYDGVKYFDVNETSFVHQYDVVISSRSVYPFVDTRFSPLFKENTYKVLWMHDTFCKGDELIESLVLSCRINTIFTLSDFHTVYVGTCDHGGKRMFEVLKDHIFMTRNGVVNYKDDVDVKEKDYNLFVYNASVTKGMIPLVTEIWPHIKRHIPEARLKVIGGYYRFRENADPDEQEKTWRELVANPEYSRLDIDFTGIIKQSEIAEILTKASWMVYPSAFPETFGISSLESLTYNTPLVACRFGALEETAIASACYLIDHSIEPNGLFPNVNKAYQIEQFVKTVVEAYRNPYLHQQKMYACNAVKDICGWDSVALQWKQHLTKKLGLYLNVHEYRKVSAINARVHEVFGRRFSNKEELMVPRNRERGILVITPMYNAGAYIGKCIQSVISQDYDNYIMIVIDDASPNQIGYELAKWYQNDHFKIIVEKNEDNKGALANQIDNIFKYYSDYSDIVVLLDGDDSLVNDNQIFQKINNIYQDKEVKMTYGSCWSMADNIPLVAQPYPKKVFEDRSFKDYKFPWNIPYTHLRTFEMRYLTDNVLDKCKDESGEYYRAGGDSALFYALIEELKYNEVKAVPDILVNYNDLNPLNDYKINGEEQTKNANNIMEKGKMNKLKSILIAVPTNKYVETGTMKSIYDLEVPSGCRTELQFFYGYQIDQVRNLIAEWGKKYDYLFCVDSDIVLPRETLSKFVFSQKDVISGVYVQRLPGEPQAEIYRPDYSRYPYDVLMTADRQFEVGACGFGCVLIDSKVLRDMEYPHFVYKSALDHAHTLSEDVYFCQKAREKGFKVWCDTSIRCGHIGQNVYSCPEVVTNCIEEKTEDVVGELESYIKAVAHQDLLPECHRQYLYNMPVRPKVVYDVGACVAHWGRHAKKAWKDAEIYAFEANDDCFETLVNSNIYSSHCMAVLSHTDGMEVDFYHNPYNLGGNSYYKENTNEFNESHIEKRTTKTLDSYMLDNLVGAPDLIKIDVQGAELDVLEGATLCLRHCKDVIIECQHADYNEGAPKFEAVKNFLERRGFKLVSNFCRTEVDGDYHFTKI